MLPGGVFSKKYSSELAIIRTKTQWFWLVIALSVLFVAIPRTVNDYWLLTLTLWSITIISVLGLHILNGLCGLFSIGHTAFMAVGAYIVAILTTQLNWNGWFCLPLSALGAGLVGLVFAIPCFRLKMFYLAITTFAGHAIIIWCIKYRDFWDVTGGFTGIRMDPLTLGGIDFKSTGNYYLLVAVMLVLATLVTKNIQRSNTGRVFVAIRDNETAAKVTGIAVFQNKLLAFFIGCTFAGVAGWLWAYSQLRVNPEQFSMHDSILFAGMMIVGGMGSTTGVFLGVIFLKGLGIVNTDFISPFMVDVLPARWASQVQVAFSLILYAVVIILFLRFMPRGLYYYWQKFKVLYRLYPYSNRKKWWVSSE